MKTVCLITGATNGIGLATAQALAREDMTLVLHGRDAGLLETRRAELSGAGAQANVQIIQADFAALDSVRAMADEFKTRFDRLDILFNNAGQLTDHRQTGADGFELTFTVNHLAPMLLTWSLLPLLKKSAPARILFNSSSALGDALLDLDDLQSENWHGGWAAYANSKLANMLMSGLLAEELRADEVVSNAFCPGLIATGLLKHNSEFSAVMLEHIRKRERTPADGAITPLYLATAPEAQAISGAFFMKSRGGGKVPLEINWDRQTAVALRDKTAELLAPWLADAPGRADSAA